MWAGIFQNFEQWIEKELTSLGFSTETSGNIAFIILLIVITLTALLLQVAIRWAIRGVVERIKDNSKFPVFKYLRERRFPHQLAQIFPILFLLEVIPIAFVHFPRSGMFITKIIQAYSVFAVIWIILAFARSVMDSLKEKPAFREKPMESWAQVIYITLVCIGFFFIYNIFTDKSLGELFTYLGAASAILLLIFKDTILGFVASITVTTNDMVRIGDWITMPESNADGDVIEINLNTVKVQNFDKTITTIPTYKLISASFQNWRGMQNAGGRRIKRSIYIIQSTVRFVEEPDLIRLAKIQEIEGYITERRKEIEEYNSEKRADKRVLINGRNMTNLGLFRKYADYYLKNHPRINKKLTMMVRQLAATSKGIPLEIYAFTDTTNWVEYETIQSDIFDHLIAAVPFFDLEIFEDLHNIPNKKQSFDI
ncbi:MAG: mechanosensitive ion channel [Capnocytophaga sp.]|nr:mechanosensitive ion channel [Capnocytophaga sp.]